jgi:hypothetical protein
MILDNSTDFLSDSNREMIIKQRHEEEYHACLHLYFVFNI